MMYALSPTAQDIVAGSSVAGNFTIKIQTEHLLFWQEFLIGKV
jgi:hypothetical protein